MATVNGKDQPSNRDVAGVCFILLRKVRGVELQIIHGQPATIGLVGMSTRLPREIRPHHALGVRPPVPETLLEKAKISGIEKWG